MRKDQPLRMLAQTSDFDKIHQYIESRLSACSVNDDADREDILLAAMEAVCNILVHGYQNKKGWIEVEISREGNAILVRLRDKAPHFDPPTTPSPDLSTPLEDRPMGGMGIHLIKELMDNMVYHPRPQDGNKLVLEKFVRFEGE
jgi:serine/threonine-protein kinase RsbW